VTAAVGESKQTMDKHTGLQSTLRIEDVPTVRSMVARKLREAIMSGRFKPGQRLVERELCEMTGVSRPSIREALRLLEADGLVNTVARVCMTPPSFAGWGMHSPN
jgi:DNA-binding GntR family transcriptional regulator